MVDVLLDGSSTVHFGCRRVEPLHLRGRWIRRQHGTEQCGGLRPEEPGMATDRFDVHSTVISWCGSVEPAAVRHRRLRWVHSAVPVVG